MFLKEIYEIAFEQVDKELEQIKTVIIKPPNENELKIE